MSKPYIGYIVAPAAYRPTLQALAVKLGDGGQAELLNFGIEFCLASDPTTITHYGGSTGPIDQQVVDYIEANVLKTLPASTFWMRCVNEPFPARVIKTNYTPSQTRIDAGEVIVFNLQSILTKIGMIIYDRNGL